MASSSSQPKKYDVFISFRGADIRDGFLSHLHKALVDEGIDAFVDENVERGKYVSTSLWETIEQSYISLVIFSENYAFSPWCLEELVKILHCMKAMGQILILVFYRIDPTHVQELTESYGVAIAKHKDELKDSLDEVENWCRVLKETSGMSGLVSQDVKHDSILIEEINEHVIKNLESLYPLDSCRDDLVGMDSRVSEVESLLCLESIDVRVVGIWGMGGIGKTTIANEVFNKIRHQFPNQCFIERVREKLESYTPDRLQSEILSELLETKNSNTAAPILLSPFNRKRLSRKKVLLVLDDVSDFDQVERLIGQVNYGPWSRIIMTSRDKQLLKNCGAEIYEAEKLYGTESLWLFCLHAFRKSTPEKGYEILSRSAVEYAQGLPLALKVLGSNLYGKSKEEWEDELQQLQNLSDDRIQNILKISYDGLSLKDKENFLDIVFLLKSDLYRNMVESMLDLPGSKIGISRLIDKCLIYISKNKLYMHDLIQQMGKDIICSENQLGKRRRLSHPEDICHAVKRIKGVETIRGISLNMSKIKDVQFSPKAFEKMENLRYLIFYDKNEEEEEEEENKIHFSERLESVSDELRFLHWSGCPLESLPLNFSAEKLVKLDMVESKLKELWKRVQDLKNLKEIDLSNSKDLVRIPDLSKAVNLEILILKGCSSLVEILSSINYLSKLTHLDLSDCTSLCSFPSCLHLENLKRLDLSYCSDISVLPNIECHQLSSLYLTGCAKLESLPDSICNLIFLKEICIDGCENLHRLPENLGNLESLVTLRADGSGIRDLPDSICHLKSIQTLDFSDCKNLVGLPVNLLNNLESLENLDLRGCTSLKSLSQPVKKLYDVSQFNFQNCLNLEEEERNKLTNWLFERPWFGSHNLELCIPGSEVEQRMKYKNKNGSSLSFQFTQFERLGDLRGLYFCAVFNPSLFNSSPLSFSVGCEILIDGTHAVIRQGYMSLNRLYLRSKHVFLWRDIFKLPDNPPLGQIDFVFFISDAFNSELRYDGGIIECGVHPLFYDEFIPPSSGSDDRWIFYIYQDELVKCVSYAS
ncbi:disease resistance protein RPV1-like [Mercurialis annua]|uniref:disease resistance protein RPV1-like n=1 Tax=Mercurialis annua TaxID=3986 RepID=UPI0024AE8E13|nr:disease resistance protein RPV1-like [Mercurialis annua]